MVDSYQPRVRIRLRCGYRHTKTMVMSSTKPVVSFDFRAPIAFFSVRPSSAWSVLSPSLLTCLHDFVHVSRWPNLENVAIRHRRMLRHELYSMIHVPRLKDENAAELFLGFGIGAIGRCHFAVLPIQGQGGLRPLERFSAGPVPAGTKMVVVFKA